MSSIFNFEINFFYRFDFKSYQKQKRFFLTEIRGQSKKVFLDLGHIEKWGFLHGVQHVSNTGCLPATAT